MQIVPNPGQSEAERVSQMTDADADIWFKANQQRLPMIEQDWTFWRRDNQMPPENDWRVWFIMAGRGFGKTRMAAEYIRAAAETDGSLRIALVASTLHEARTIMVEGESGLLSISSDDDRPVYEPSLRRLTWRSGAAATLYGASDPDALRGPEHGLAWADEVAKWDNGVATWDNLMMTMRSGSHPRVVATTTPRPVPLIRRLLKEKGVAISHGKMTDNRAQLPDAFITAMQNIYGQSRLGRQELAGELLENIDGALWPRDLIERCRVAVPPAMKRIVIGVDPPASSTGDACGIIAVGLGIDGKAYVLGDHSVSGRSPEGWARAVAGAAEAWGADRVIAEANQGGDMVESTLRAADVGMPVKKVHASRGKIARAEPVAALYEAGKAFHAGAFPETEDELCGMISGGSYEGPGRSPDRADALVWAMTEVMLGKRGAEPRVRGV